MGLARLNFFKFIQETYHLPVKSPSHFLVLTNLDIEINKNIELIFFGDLVDMLEHFYDLRHHCDFFYDFFKDVRHLDNFVLCDNDRISVSFDDFSGCFEHFINSMNSVYYFFLNFPVKLFFHVHFNDFSVLGVPLGSGHHCFLDEFLNIGFLDEIGHFY